jgi:hypothetical protein
VIGYTSYLSPAGQMSPGTIVRIEDPSQDPLVKGSDGQLTYAGTQSELYQVVLHEIGHALGLADNSDPNSVMYYASGPQNRTLDKTDVTGIQALYGATQSPASFAGFSPAVCGFGGSDTRLSKMIQAMGTLHDNAGAAWSEPSHPAYAAPPAPEPAIGLSQHVH